MGRSIEVIESKMYEGVVADEIVALISDAISERGRCTVVLAGGRTPAEIYRTLALPPRVHDINWEHVSLFWGDERWVKHSDDQSNYKMVRETLLDHLSEPRPKVFPIDTALSTPEQAAQHYEQLIRKELNCPAPAVPSFDIILLGVGDDGHFASIFPGSSSITASDGPLCYATTQPQSGQKRVTLSAEVLMHAKRVVFVVKGAAKAEILERILKGNIDPNQLPVTIFRKVEDRVAWFIDTPAAQRINGNL